MNSIYRFPDGHSIRYALKYDSGKNNTRFKRVTTNSKAFKEALNSSEKRDKPLIFLKSSWQFPLICGDFDSLDSRFQNFNELFQYLSNTYSHIGCVTKTPSDKCKVYFQVECKNTYESNLLSSLKTLEAVLDADDYELIDKCSSANNQAYLTPQMLTALQTWNPVLIAPVIEDYTPSYWYEESQVAEKLSELIYEPISNYIDLSLPRVQRALESLSEPLNRIFKRSKRKEQIAQWLVWSAPRLLNGTEINQKVAAQLLECDRTFIAKIIKKLKQHDLLEVTNNKFSPNNKSKEYKAKGILLKILQESLPKRKVSIEDLRKTTIINGCANSQYLELVNNFYWLGEEKLLSELLILDSRRPKDKQRDKDYFTTIINNCNKFKGSLKEKTA